MRSLIASLLMKMGLRTQIEDWIVTRAHEFWAGEPLSDSRRQYSRCQRTDDVEQWALKAVGVVSLTLRRQQRVVDRCSHDLQPIDLVLRSMQHSDSQLVAGHAILAQCFKFI